MRRNFCSASPIKLIHSSSAATFVLIDLAVWDSLTTSQERKSLVGIAVRSSLLYFLHASIEAYRQARKRESLGDVTASRWFEMAHPTR